MPGLHIQLFSETADVKPSDLYRLAKAAEVNAAHCADAWSLARPAIDIGGDRSKLVKGSIPVVFLDDSADPSKLADHYYDPLRLAPAARVYVDRASGFHTGSHSLSESLCHEVVELMVNPRLDRWTHAPGRDGGIQVAEEIADPVQTHYEVEIDGAEYNVANFVTPAWFRSDLSDERAKDFLFAGGKFDWSGELNRAGQIGRHGYLILREWVSVAGRGYWRRYSTDIGGHALVGSSSKDHPWSRTTLLMGDRQ